MSKQARKYLIMDTETATLPFVSGMCKTVNEKRTLAIAKPLIYDIAWKIVDRNGKEYSRHSYLVTEIFSVPSVFNTAYYKEKRPLYLDRLKNGEITLKNWYDIMDILEEDLKDVAFVGAFNSMFDYKKAMIFTENYMKNLYSPHYQDWEEKQKLRCIAILNGDKYKNEDWDGLHFDFRDKQYKLIDLWGISCEMLINTVSYKRKCLKHGMLTDTGQFFKTSAESTFRYLCDKMDFEEMHMAIDDVNIECQILCKALKKGKITEGIIYFPFQILGKTTKFILHDTKRKISKEEVQNVIDKIEEKLLTYEKESTYVTILERELYQLIGYLQNGYDKTIHLKRSRELENKELERQILKQEKRLSKLKEMGTKWYDCKELIKELKEKLEIERIIQREM